MNKVIMIGRLTKDPTLTFAAGTGNAICKFSMAVDRPQFDKSKPKEVDFINFTCFSKKGEAIANYVLKGHRFCVNGRLQNNSYADKDGNKRTSTDVIVEDFEFIQSKASGQANTSNQGSFEDEFMSPVDDGEIPF